MKRLIFFTAVLVAAVSGCKKAEYLVYSDVPRLQMRDTAELTSTFVYSDASVTRDTIYVLVNTIGGIADHDRPVKIVQVPEYDYTLVRDPVTNVVLDTVWSERPFKAEPGLHYVSLEDKSLEHLMVVKKDSVVAWIPVILLRDASLKNNTYRLRLELRGNSDFGLGETKAGARTVVFSDRLERFYSWRFDNGTAPAFYSLGKYSTAKHKFISDALDGMVIDEDWYQASLKAGAYQHYVNLVKEKLAVFNSDPANIASGKAPLRESADPASPAVTFP